MPFSSLRFRSIAPLLLVLSFWLPIANAEEEAGCNAPLAVQVLGSGGPIADDDRASAAYLVWVDGKPRVLVDAGGGSFVRFGQSGADFADLSAILLSHFHTDHAAELPALLKSAWFGPRTAPLPIVGPSGNARFPNLGGYLEALFGRNGAYAYLGGFLKGGAGSFVLTPVVVDIGQSGAQTVYRDKRMTVSALPVPHGPVPALAFRVEVDKHVMVFAGDQNGSSENFTAFADGADLMVLHFAIPDDADPIARRLHATPARLCEMAAASGTHNLVLSHIMQRAWLQRDDGIASIRRHYSGPLSLASDLDCYPVTSTSKK
jgi:ribonuclease BN (tRNA processing enzyme)